MVTGSSARPLCRFLVTAGLLILGSCGVAAAAQVRLTEVLVRGYLDSRPELERLGKSFVATYGDRSGEDDGGAVDALPAYLDIPAARTQVGAVLQRFGFKDLDQWRDVSDSVLTTAGYLDPANPPPDAEAEKRKAQAEIAADATLSAEQKTSALQQLDAQFAPLFDSVPLPENIPVVRPFAARVQALTGTP